jgi:hypothetical protein
MQYTFIMFHHSLHSRIKRQLMFFDLHLPSWNYFRHCGCGAYCCCQETILLVETFLDVSTRKSTRISIRRLVFPPLFSFAGRTRSSFPGGIEPPDSSRLVMTVLPPRRRFVDFYSMAWSLVLEYTMYPITRVMDTNNSGKRLTLPASFEFFSASSLFKNRRSR